MVIYKNKQLYRVYFIGIGGIGVSALAQYYLIKGHRVVDETSSHLHASSGGICVEGSDIISSEITETLKKKGVKIFIDQKAKNITKNIDLVVYSPAIQLDNPEFKKAKELGIKTLSYPEALGKLTKEYFTIAVTGTHGKSTTTAMIGLLLTKAGLDPTVIVGTKVKEFGDSNFRIGNSKYLVIEACEYKKSFLNYSPNIAVITNIESDHLSYFKNFNNVKKAFAEFVKKIKKDGVLITEKIYRYKKTEDTKKLKKILKVPGEHNVFNALAALAVARALKISDKISFKALSEYCGSWRRFEEQELKIENCKLKIISDYAHHPTEVKVTLKTAREKYLNKKIWCIFQPHQYNRTYHFFDDFVKVLKTVKIDKIIVTDIYSVAGRESENIKKKVNSEKLVKTVNKPSVIYLPKEEIINHLKENLRGGEVVIIMGAGDIYQLISNF